MRNVSVDDHKRRMRTNSQDELIGRPEQPSLPEASKLLNRLLHLQDNDFSSLEKIPLNARVIIIEGIAGSGKDTFQNYLKSKLRDRNVYHYSEGDLLLSWNQRPIKDIFKMQIRFMINFLEYVAVTLESDEKAVFLLNRFHLSTYTMGVTEQPKLAREYNIVLQRLRMLPAHVFILLLMENEIESRSSHPERGPAWHKFQQHILQREGFQNFAKRNVLLQKAMIETAVRQQVPFSVFRLPSIPNARIIESRERRTRIGKSLDAELGHLTRK